jgi:16S rRNA processing protein RimM
VPAGRVGRPHGLDGSFHVVLVDAELLRDRDVVFLSAAPHRIARRAGTEEKPILRLEGASSRDDAEALRGQEITVPREDIALEADEYWASDLEGCAVVDGGAAIGFVRRMSALPSCEVLEVDRADGSELLVPMVRDAIRSIDVVARRIDIDMEFLAG